MNTQTLFTGLRTLALAGTAAFFVGCMTQEEGKTSNYDSDGQGAFLVTEMDQMGQSLGQFTASGLPKTSAEVALDIEIKGELVIDPWAYSADCQCFVRKAQYTGHKGYERERLDSVTFLDSAGATMDKYHPAQVAKALYRRSVHHSKGAKEADVRIDITVDIKSEGGAKVGVWNGTMSGTFNGQEFKSGTVTNVVRPYLDGHFRFPEAGTLELTRPVYRFLVTFLGDGKAKVVITNRLNKRIHILWVDHDYKETAPVAE